MAEGHPHGPTCGVFSDRTLKTSVQPNHPAFNVLPEPTQVGSFLLKTVRTFNQSGEASNSP